MKSGVLSNIHSDMFVLNDNQDLTIQDLINQDICNQDLINNLLKVQE